MKQETIAIHSGYDVDPTTKAVTVPIYQTDLKQALDATTMATTKGEPDARFV